MPPKRTIVSDENADPRVEAGVPVYVSKQSVPSNMVQAKLPCANSRSNYQMSAAQFPPEYDCLGSVKSQFPNALSIVAESIKLSNECRAISTGV